MQPLNSKTSSTPGARWTIRSAEYEADRADIRAIRFEVFVDEQQVPPEIEMDDRDPHCVHVLAYDGSRAIGTARIDIEQSGKVGRLAVRSRWRRQGVGQALMECCHETARRHGLRAVWCNAQVTAIPFYEQLGYRVTSAPFEEAGIDHRRMALTLVPE